MKVIRYQVERREDSRTAVVEDHSQSEKEMRYLKNALERENPKSIYRLVEVVEICRVLERTEW